MKSCWAQHITYYISHPSSFLYLFEVHFFLKMFSICDHLIRVLGMYRDSGLRESPTVMDDSIAGLCRQSYCSRNCEWKGFVFEVASKSAFGVGWMGLDDSSFPPERVLWRVLARARFQAGKCSFLLFSLLLCLTFSSIPEQMWEHQGICCF